MRKYLENIRRYGIRLPSFFSGAASVLDICPSPPDPPLTDREAFEADAEALRGDWNQVCSDFRTMVPGRKGTRK